ncbi:excisionase family DNA-binding protein [Thalassobacillus pellis]|uniref:excisionase family DNA-binding protein n=1 Tax=Thalassobacillus pellis TaxID=748008 RepID=UPI0019618162|nr:excisionase family DNA-binding protein [Thalassobacillus pellis]MBM7553488.1 excisionase family DNA binding protein [Thalassobacillus pellis]
MYLTIKETAEYLDVPETFIQKLILENKIRTLDDGKEVLVNKEQFSTYFQQVEKYRALMEEYWDQPIPDDIDIKDED